MDYLKLQRRIYENKVRRGFNVTDIGKEVILMTEEFGELCEGEILDHREETIDAVGDLMVYCLGLSAMFQWNANEVINSNVTFKKEPRSVQDYLPYLGREVGRIAKTYKKSNKQPVDQLDQREEFKTHVGDLMGYCSKLFYYLQVDESSVLEQIVAANESRTHQGQI